MTEEVKKRKNHMTGKNNPIISLSLTMDDDNKFDINKNNQSYDFILKKDY